MMAKETKKKMAVKETKAKKTKKRKLPPEFIVNIEKVKASAKGKKSKAKSS